MWISKYQHHLLKQLSVPNSFCTFVGPASLYCLALYKNPLTIKLRMYFWTQFWSTELWAYLYTNVPLLTLLYDVSPEFCSFFQNYFGYVKFFLLLYLNVVIILTNHFCNKKNECASWDFDRDQIKFVGQFGENWYLNTEFSGHLSGSVR